MKKITLIMAFGAIGAVAAYFLVGVVKSDRHQIKQLVLSSEEYSAAAKEISKKINDISPTPPTEMTWVVSEVEFVKGEPYAYVIYHDTHSIFRILIETGWKPYSSVQENSYRTVATFEPSDSGWRLANGQDLAVGRETVKINPN